MGRNRSISESQYKTQFMIFVGIDVGAKYCHIVGYPENGRNIIIKERIGRYERVLEKLAGQDCRIAIDAPSDLRKNKNERRECERRFGIGGYYATPYYRKDAKPWMQAGFKLRDFLRKNGFKNLIEVHPTLIFKKIQNPRVKNRLLMSRRKPVSKSKAEGKTQRIEILRKFFDDKVIERIGRNIDYIDALIGAYCAEQAYKGNAEKEGNPEEGYIWVPASHP